MQVVGLEVSTSSAKAILFSQSGEILGECSEKLPVSVSGVTWQEPEGIFSAAIKCLQGVTKYATAPIQGIGLAGIWHSMLLLDESRKPLDLIRTWADLSTASFIQNIKQDDSIASDFYQRTGCIIHGMYPIWKLYGLNQARSPLLSKVHYVSSQIEYLFQRFTGDVRVSACTASGTGFFNIHSTTWDQKLVDLAGIRLDMLAPLAEADYYAPLSSEIATLTGLKAGIPVTIGCADGALNQIGSGAMAPGVMTLSVGTSSAVRVVTPTPLLGARRGTWCYYLMNGQRLAGAATHGASNLEWFMRQFGYTDQDHSRLAAVAMELDVDDGPIFLPFIFGERAPGWNEERGGSFVGMRSSHGEAHLYKAVLEGILYVLYHSYLQLIGIATEPEQIRMSGGILKSKYWSKMAADIWGLSLFTTGNVHESTLGAALLALQACGGLSAKDFNPPLVGRIDPDKRLHSLYQKRFARYIEVYDALARW